MVRNHLKAIVEVNMHFEADLTAPWTTKVFITDAAPSGFGVVSNADNVDESRDTAKWSETQGWEITAEQVHPRVEEIKSQPKRSSPWTKCPGLGNWGGEASWNFSAGQPA